MSDPLETRSLPGAFWGRIPEQWYQWDVRLQEYISSHLDLSQSPWKQLRFLSEDPRGLALTFGSAIGLLALYLYRRKGLRGSHFKLFLQRQWRGLILFLAFAGFSDTLSNLIKRAVGRLKPHVNFYNTYFLPALSLPSNHAFNTSFLVALVFFSLDFEKRRRHLSLFVLAYSVVFLVGISRVFFGQHYPLDVLCGWLFGSFFGYALSDFYYRLQNLRGRRLKA